MEEVVHDRAAVLAVGDELVLGESLDTNSAWISARLMEHGIRVVEHATVGDDLERLTAALLRLGAAYPLVVVTGGLGPTRDDLTRRALARATEESLVEDADALAWLEEMMRARGTTLTPDRRVQAQRPAGAMCLRNQVGTAPGLYGRMVAPVEILELSDVEGRTLSREEDVCDVFCLPGPPREMMPMFEREVVSRLAPPRGKAIAVRLVRTFGLPEAEVARRLGDMMERGRNPIVGTTASGGVVTVRVRYEGSAAGSQEGVKEIVARVRDRIGEYVFGEGDTTLPEALVGALRDRAERLVVVESCTGGKIGALVTSVPGASNVFDGGWITYANTMKVGQVGVKEQLITGGPGAVSREVAEAMAEGALEAARRESVDATHALAITGIAGPGGGSKDKPVGTVWVCRASRADDAIDIDSRRFLIPGDREDVRERSAMLALGMLWHHVVHARSPRLIWEVGEGKVAAGAKQ